MLNANDVKTGTPATICYPDDAYPAVVVEATAKFATLVPVKTVSESTGHQPAYYNGSFPVWDHTYTEDEIKTLRRDNFPTTRVSRRKNGRWYIVGTKVPVKMGEAHYRRNFAY